MKIISFNVNGIRAIAKKDFFRDFESLAPDILCLQETKAQDDQVADTLSPIEGYHIFSNSAVKKVIPERPSFQNWNPKVFQKILELKCMIRKAGFCA